jgi:hypothetical protein
MQCKDLAYDIQRGALMVMLRESGRERETETDAERERERERDRE